MTEFLSLDGRVAIITGGARGIGKAIAETLAQRGANIVVVDLRKELAEETANEISAKTGREAIALEADVSNQESVKAMIKDALEKFGKVDILVNNAGITRDGLIMRMKESDWDMVLDINLKGAFNCAQAIVRPMMKQQYGRIINISSVSTHITARNLDHVGTLSRCERDEKEHTYTYPFKIWYVQNTGGCAQPSVLVFVFVLGFQRI